MVSQLSQQGGIVRLLDLETSSLRSIGRIPLNLKNIKRTALNPHVEPLLKGKRCIIEIRLERFDEVRIRAVLHLVCLQILPQGIVEICVSHQQI